MYQIKCDGNGLGHTVTGLTLKNNLSKNLYCSKVQFPFLSIRQIDLDNLKFFFTQMVIFSEIISVSTELMQLMLLHR